MTRYPICGIMCLAFAGVAHLVERDLAKVEVASSSLVARSKKKTPSVRMVFSFWNIAGRLELAASTGAKRVKAYVFAALRSLCAGKKLPSARLMAEGTDTRGCFAPSERQLGAPCKGQQKTPAVAGVLAFVRRLWVYQRGNASLLQQNERFLIAKPVSSGRPACCDPEHGCPPPPGRWRGSPAGRR